MPSFRRFGLAVYRILVLQGRLSRLEAGLCLAVADWLSYRPHCDFVTLHRVLSRWPLVFAARVLRLRSAARVLERGLTELPVTYAPYTAKRVTFAGGLRLPVDLFDPMRYAPTRASVRTPTPAPRPGRC